MKELLDTLDESVFTPELNEKIQGLYESKLNEIKSEYEAKLQESEAKVQEAEEKVVEIEAKATEYAEMVKEEMETKASAYAEYVKEEMETKASEYTEYVKEELTKKVSAYLDTVVEQYVEANKIAIDESVKSAKMNAILEGFDSLLVTSGVALSQLVEAKQDTSSESELSELNKKLDKLVSENAKLKEEKAALIKESVLNKISSDMSLAQKDKFEKLSEMVVFTGNVEDYEARLSTIVETIMATKPATPAPAHKEDKQIVEGVEPKTFKESYGRYI